MIFENKTLTLVYSKTFEKKYTFAVDSKPNPAHIDVHHGEAKALGIFERDGDTLRICMGPWQGERPTEFKEKGKNVILLTLMREKKDDGLRIPNIPLDPAPSARRRSGGPNARHFATGISGLARLLNPKIVKSLR